MKNLKHINETVKYRKVTITTNSNTQRLKMELRQTLIEYRAKKIGQVDCSLTDKLVSDLINVLKDEVLDAIK